MSNHDYLKSICLLGTDRQAIQMEKLSAPINKALAAISSSDESEKVLHALSLNHYYLKAGSILKKANNIIETAPIEEKFPYASEAYCKLLNDITDLDKQRMQVKLLRTWVGKIIEQKNIVHPLYLVKYLNLLRLCSKNLIEDAAPSYGEKGNWLIKQNPKYNNLMQQPVEDIWSHGNSDQRNQFLSSLLNLDTDKAIQVLASDWSTESSKEKLKHIKTIKNHLGPKLLPYLEDLYYSEFAFNAKERVTQRQTREQIAQSLLLLKNSKLHQQTTQKLSEYTVSKKGGLISKVFQSQKEIIQIPEQDDNFFNKQNMLEVYGLDPKSNSISDFRTDQLYWFSKLVATLPFDSWAAITSQKEKKAISSFLNSKQFEINIEGKKQSCLRRPLFELSNYYRDDEYILSLIELEKDKSIIQLLLSKLTPEAWENYLEKNLELVENTVLVECPHHGKDHWSAKFSNTLVNHILDRAKNNKIHDYNIGTTMSQYLHSDSLSYLQNLNRTKAQNLNNYNYWKNHIFDPISNLMNIRLQIESY